MFASHHRHRMGRLVVVIDANNSQVDGSVTSVTTIEPLADKWRSFGWRVAEVDGHDVDALSEAFASRIRRRRTIRRHRAHRHSRTNAINSADHRRTLHQARSRSRARPDDRTGSRSCVNHLIRPC